MSETKCQRCAGCGKIADSDSGEPWVYWLELPVQSALAVIAGIVNPIPCPDCGGTGTPDRVRVCARQLLDCLNEFDTDPSACAEWADALDRALSGLPPVRYEETPR